MTQLAKLSTSIDYYITVLLCNHYPFGRTHSLRISFNLFYTRVKKRKMLLIAVWVRFCNKLKSFRCNKIFFYKKLKNVSCEDNRLNGWNSTLQAAWYIIHVRIIWFLWSKPTIWLLILSFTQNIVRACSVFYLYRFLERRTGLHFP